MLKDRHKEDRAELVRKLRVAVSVAVQTEVANTLCCAAKEPPAVPLLGGEERQAWSTSRQECSAL